MVRQMEQEILSKIHEDLESLKRDMSEIKAVINLEPELREEIRLQVEEARKRIAEGKCLSNREMLKEFGLE